MAAEQGNTEFHQFATEIAHETFRLDALLVGARALATSTLESSDQAAHEAALNMEILLDLASDRLDSMRAAAGSAANRSTPRLSAQSPS